MMKKYLMTVLFLCISAMSMMAQETVMRNTGNIKSPEVNNDGTVTFMRKT